MPFSQEQLVQSTEAVRQRRIAKLLREKAAYSLEDGSLVMGVVEMRTCGNPKCKARSYQLGGGLRCPHCGADPSLSFDSDGDGCSQ